MKYFLNSVFHGNCLDILPRFDPDFFDLTVTSPPYDQLRAYHGYHFDCASIAKALFRVTKPGGVVVWVVADGVVDGGETGTSFRQALTFQETGFRLHDTMIYEKNTCSFPASRKGNRYSQTFEYMYVFSKGKPKTANLLCDKPNKWAGTTNWGKNTDRGRDGQLRQKKDIKPVQDFSPRNNVWRYVPEFEKDDEAAEDVVASEIRRYVVGGGFGQKDRSAYKHPATYPEQLAADHILTWSRPGDVVLDPMAGSFTTCLAAQRLDRQFIGIDISKEYCEDACRRLDCRCISLGSERMAG
jgi:site-specific DNA-methyltransferase (adenine-specific)